MQILGNAFLADECDFSLYLLHCALVVSFNALLHRPALILQRREVKCQKKKKRHRFTLPF